MRLSMVLSSSRLVTHRFVVVDESDQVVALDTVVLIGCPIPPAIGRFNRGAERLTF
ncbi:MAG: hypothetical protein O7E52_21805 [Candidatus Poribacteria bacterium]|nr:hypothetical protein [Candidatus Poribacteria bacterium]